MKKKIVIVVGALLAANMSVAQAAEDQVQNPVAGHPTVSDLGRYQAEISVLEAKLKAEKLKADIANVNHKSSEQLTGAPNSTVDPKVISIQGADGNLSADVRLADGSIMTVKKGSRIQGGYKVLSIAQDAVTVLRRGSRFELMFTAPQDPSPSYAAQPGMPGIPMGGPIPPLPTLPAGK